MQAELGFENCIYNYRKHSSISPQLCRFSVRATPPESHTPKASTQFQINFSKETKKRPYVSVSSGSTGTKAGAGDHGGVTTRRCPPPHPTLWLQPLESLLRASGKSCVEKQCTAVTCTQGTPKYLRRVSASCLRNSCGVLPGADAEKTEPVSCIEL